MKNRPYAAAAAVAVFVRKCALRVCDFGRRVNVCVCVFLRL